MLDHIHIHCIVPGGALSKDGQKWHGTKDDFLFPLKVVQRLYRGKFMAFFKEALDSKKISFLPKPYNDNYQLLDNLYSELYHKEWKVYIKPPFAGPKAVIKYLSRYTHRVAISNQRIKKFENGMVTFKYKDYADKSRTKEMTISAIEFIRRFLLHVLPTGFMKIRHYGYLSNRSLKIKLPKCRQAIIIINPHLIAEVADVINTLEQRINESLPKLCPMCLQDVMVMKRCFYSEPPGVKVA